MDSAKLKPRINHRRYVADTAQGCSVLSDPSEASEQSTPFGPRGHYSKPVSLYPRVNLEAGTWNIKGDVDSLKPFVKPIPADLNVCWSEC